MDVTMTDIKKLREMTGAGLADCKKALAESDDMDGAVAYLRKKGAAVAAKRSDREAAEVVYLLRLRMALVLSLP
jgi:elongation factor Ts